MPKINILIAALAATALIAPLAQAQEDSEPSDAAEEAETAETENTEEASDEDIADQLNSQQQLKQTFTLKRTINGQVVETTKKTVVLSPGVPYRPTEAGETTLQQVRDAFDREVLTRVEAFEEAKLDFTIADVDRDDRMSAEEFAGLVETWQRTGAKQPEAAELTEDEARQRQFEALFGPTEPDGDTMDADDYALAKFRFISGAATTISREDYIREYLLDFDTMDFDKDTLLKGDELLRFRAANRGETIEM